MFVSYSFDFFSFILRFYAINIDIDNLLLLIHFTSFPGLLTVFLKFKVNQ